VGEAVGSTFPSKRVMGKVHCIVGFRREQRRKRIGGGIQHMAQDRFAEEASHPKLRLALQVKMSHEHDWISDSISINIRVWEQSNYFSGVSELAVWFETKTWIEY
jgi:hypothetical protein